MSISKILHVNFSGKYGGAAIAAARLHRALLRSGTESEFRCLRDPSGDPFVSAVTRGAAKKVNGAKNRIIQGLARWLGGGIARSYNVMPSGLARLINRTDAGIIHLHWVCGEMISIAELAKIKKPVVWTLHDMWPFCGAEHVTTDNRYITGYQSSEFNVQSSELGFRESERGWPDASSLRPQAFFDLDRWTFLRKQKHWKNWKPHIVTPSNWLADCARQSVLFKDLPIEVIPNCLDLKIFKPMDRVAARKKFNLPPDKKLILFGAYNPFDHNKGGDLLAEALTKRNLSASGVELVVFGATNGPQIAGLLTHWMGTFSSESDLSQLYNAADVVVVPSRQENLPNTVAEAVSCGTPVVAFDIGGLPDMVGHKKNGWLAEPYNTEDLASGIIWATGLSREQAKVVSAAARSQAKELFAEAGITALYLDVYQRARSLKA